MLISNRCLDEIFCWCWFVNKKIRVVFNYVLVNVMIGKFSVNEVLVFVLIMSNIMVSLVLLLILSRLGLVIGLLVIVCKMLLDNVRV